MKAHCATKGAQQAAYFCVAFKTEAPFVALYLQTCLELFSAVRLTYPSAVAHGDLVGFSYQSNTHLMQSQELTTWQLLTVSSQACRCKWDHDVFLGQ